MKMIRRSWMILTILFAALFLSPAMLQAASADAAGRYDAVSCRQGEDSFTCDGEYLLLEKDGSGEVCYNGSVYSFEWTLDGDQFSFTDEDDYVAEGTLKDGVIEALVYDYEYTYEKKQGASGEAAAAGEDSDSEDASAEEGDPAGGADASAEEGDSSDDSEASQGSSLQENLTNSQAASSEGPAVYYVSSRDSAGASDGPSENDWSSDYIALNEDGTGVFLFDNAALAMTWEQDGNTFTFTDHLDNVFEGTASKTKISGQYSRYSYTFERVYDTLPVFRIAPDQWGKGLDYVTDEAGVLSESQLSELNSQAKELTEKYDVGVYVVLLGSRDDYTWSGNIETLGEEIRAGYSIGVGYTDKKEKHESASVNPQWKDSLLLTIAFDVRKYDICASGEYGNWAFSDYARGYIRDNVVDDFKENRWEAGLSDYMKEVGNVLAVSAKGRQFTYRDTGMGRLIGILVPIVLALLFGYGIAAGMRSSMQNTQKALNAAAYVAGDQVNFTRRQDYYIRTLVSRVYSPREKSKGGGGGGHSSGGSSHTSGSF